MIFLVRVCGTTDKLKSSRADICANAVGKRFVLLPDMKRPKSLAELRRIRRDAVLGRRGGGIPSYLAEPDPFNLTKRMADADWTVKNMFSLILAHAQAHPVRARGARCQTYDRCHQNDPGIS